MISNLINIYIYVLKTFNNHSKTLFVNKCNVQLSAGCWPWISTFILYAIMHHHGVHPSCFQRPKQTLLKKKGYKNRVIASCFFFFRIVNINIKTRFCEPISLGLEAISLTLLPLKSTRSQSRFVWRAFKNDSSGQLLGTSPGVKCLAGWSWKNSKKKQWDGSGQSGYN